MDPPYRVIFVCLGNICRSPTAEAVFRRQVAEAGLAERISVESAGTGGWHVGDGIDERAGRVLARAGYAQDHVARQFRPDWFGRADRVIAMDRNNVSALRAMARGRDDAARISLLRSYDPDAVAAGQTDVPDPYYGGSRGFDDVLAMVERACRGLLAAVRADLVARDGDAPGERDPVVLP